MSALEATWYDGRDSRGRPARLSVPAPGRLRLDSEGEAHEFALAEVGLEPRLGSLPRRLQLPGGQGHLQVADSPLLEQWMPRRNRIEAFADWLERRRTAALSAAAITVLGVVAFFQVGLPWMAERVAPLVPPAMERSISRQALALLDRTHLSPSRLPRERQDELRARFAALVAGLPRADDLRLDFRDAKGLGPNAFALPDGQVVMTDQLVRLTSDDDELLAVLAHEAGHHEHRHGMRQALQSSALVVVAGFLFGDVSGTGSLSVSIPVLLVESGFSRRHEREADAFAFELLRRRGVSPEAFARIMDKLSRGLQSLEGGPIGYLSTHPASQERMDAARRAAQAAGMAPAPEADDATEKENGR